MFQPNSNLAIVDLDSVAVNTQYIDFDYTGAITNTNPPLATGTVDGSGAGPFLVTGSSGTFSGLNGTDVSVHDLCRTGAGPCAQPVPVGSSTSFANFVVFAAKPTWSIILTQLQQGSFSSAACTSSSPAPGDVCTPAVPGGSPFNLENLGNPGGPVTGVDVSFTFLGSISDSAEGLVYPIRGIFSTTFANTDLQTIIRQIALGNTIATSASGTLTVLSGVPEPGTLPMMALGGLLLCCSLIGRRKIRA